MTSAPKGRVMKYNVPKIYVDDGSNGPNVKYSYSYPNYNDGSMPATVTNNYTNNYNRNEVHSYDSISVYFKLCNLGYTAYLFEIGKEAECLHRHIPILPFHLVEIQ